MMTALLAFSTVVAGNGFTNTIEIVHADASEKEILETSKIDLSADEIEISTPEDFYAVAKKCTLDSWSKGKTIELLNDITLTRDTQVTVAYFGGIFDGKKGKTFNNKRKD